MKKSVSFLLLCFSLITNLTGQDWTQVGFSINGSTNQYQFGRSVSLSADGNRVAVGAHEAAGSRGRVAVYGFNGTVWSRRGSYIYGEATMDHSGNSVSLSSDGKTVAIGAPQNNNSNGIDAGQVRVYDKTGAAWVQRGSDIDGEAAGDKSGWAVSISSDGNTVAIGASFNDGTTGNTNDDRGHVRVYDWDAMAMSWVLRGSDIDGESTGDRSGFSVSLSSDGNTVAIGAIDNDGTTSMPNDDRGQVRVYDWTGAAWVQRGSDMDGEAAGDNFGSSVSISSSGNTVAIGAYRNDGTTGNSTDNRGQARVYDWTGAAWVQRGSDLDGAVTKDEFGNSISLSSDGNTVAVGAHFNDGNGSNSGEVKVFDWNNSIMLWKQRGSDINGTNKRDQAGQSVSLSSSGNRVAMGSPFWPSLTTRKGQVRIFELAPPATCPADTVITCSATSDTMALGVPEPLNLGSSDSLGVDNDSLDFDSPCFNDTIGRIMRYFVIIDKDNDDRDTICIQKITVIDTIGPLIFCPPDTVLDCQASADTMFTGVAMATDACGLDSIRYEDRVVPGECPAVDTTYRLWIAVDSCGNTDSCTQVITRIDTIAPVPDAIVADTVVACRDSVPVPAMLTATDGCSGQISVLPLDSIPAGDSTCINQLIIFRTWTFTDDCGNTSQLTRVITVKDTVAPVIPQVNNVDTVNCGDIFGIVVPGGAQDNCDGLVPVESEIFVTDSICPGNYKIVMRFTASDTCGNSSEFQDTIVVQDTTAPAVIVCPSDTMVLCGESVDTAETGIPQFVEACGGVPELTYRDDSTGFAGCINDTIGVIRRKFFAVDSCGNVDSSCVQKIAIIDTVPPVFKNFRDTLEVSCKDDTIGLMLGLEIEDCHLDTVYYGEESATSGGCQDSILRIYTAIDECGNSRSKIQIIIIRDTIPPQPVACPDILEINCVGGEPLPDSKPDYVDNCSSSDNIIVITEIDSVGFDTETTEDDTIFIQYFAEDECGNVDSSCTRIVLCRLECPLINCRGEFQVELGPHCMVEITPEMILNNPIPEAFEPFCEITVTNEFGAVIPDNILTYEDRGRTFTVTIRCDIPGCGSRMCETNVKVDSGPAPLNFVSAWQSAPGGGETGTTQEVITRHRQDFVVQTGPNISNGKINVYCGNIPDPMEHVPMVADPCTGETYTPEVQPDWVMPVPCDEVSDTAEIIFRTWEAYNKEGNLSTLTDTIVVFRLPKLTPGAFVVTPEDSFYCELKAVSNNGEILKRYASWKQPVGLHDYELPYTKLSGVTYEIPATIILAGLANAAAQGPNVWEEYIHCVILRKVDGTEVTIKDIITGKYISNLISNATQEQLTYGFLQALIELNEKPLNFVFEAVFEFYPYLLLQEGDWVLSEGGNFEQVDADWFYTGNGNPEKNGAGAPYWFAGGWPSIYGSGDCISYCDLGPGAPRGGCIQVQVPKLTIEEGIPRSQTEGCDTICLPSAGHEVNLPTGVHCGITIKQDEQADPDGQAWTRTGTAQTGAAGSCPQTRGVDSWITQTCWAETLNFCVQDNRILCNVWASNLDALLQNYDNGVVDYECSDKAVKIHLSQWQTLIDTIPPVFDFCYPRRTISGFIFRDRDCNISPDWDREEIQDSIRAGKQFHSANDWERCNPAIYRVGTHDCSVDLYVPSVRLIDNCSGIHSVKAMVDVRGGVRSVPLVQTGVETAITDQGDTCYIYTYSHVSDPITIPFNGCEGEPAEVRYEAADNCWNQSEWSKYIKIVDDVPPTVVTDRNLNITLSDKLAWVQAETFDEGSWDNCAIDLRLARRTDWWADTACVDLCSDPGSNAPYDNWVDLLVDLGVSRNHAEAAVNGSTVGAGKFNADYNVDALATVLNEGEVEEHYFKQIVWLWEDSELCGKKVVHGWLYAIAAYIAENCSAEDEHGNVLQVKDLATIFDYLTGQPGYGKELAFLGGGWSKDVPFKCEDACEEVTVELAVFDYCCNWGKGWATVHVEDKSNARLVKRLPDVELTCEAYNSFYKDIVENAAALGENGSEQDTTGVFTALNNALGHYVKSWVDNQNRPTDIDGQLLHDSLLNFDYHSISCSEKSETEKIAVVGHDGKTEWVNRVTKTTYLDTTDHTGMNGIVGVNCAASCIQDVWVDLDECGQGTITRRFTIRGGCGPKAPEWTVEQVISVNSACGMRESMFDLPQNVGTKDAPICLPQALSDDYLPDTIGAVILKPHLKGKLCNSFAIGKTVKEYDVETSPGLSLKKYIIDWTVIDWCAPHTSSNRKFTYTQEVIAVIDPNCDVSTGTDTGDVSLISGHIMTELNSAVKGVNVRAVLGQGSPLNVETPGSGQFGFSIANGSQVSIVPGKNTGFSNGVSTADLIDMQRHILLKKALDSEYKRIAADVNGNGRIDGLDVLELRQLVLNPSGKFANNTSWRFFETSSHTGKLDREVYEIDPVEEDRTVNFTGVKIGDVNLSGDPARSSRSKKGSLALNIADKVLKGGELYRVEVRSDNFEDIRGMQYTLGYADAYVSIESIEPRLLNITEDNYLKYGEGLVTLSWNEAEGVSAGTGEVLFTIVMKARNAAKLRDVLSLNNRVTQTEAYAGSGALQDVGLHFDRSDEGFVLYQNTPNPYTGETVIGFKLPYESAATMTIYDVTGGVIKTIQGDYQEGYNEVRVRSEELGTTGVLYYQLDTDRYTATKKMIIVE